MHRFQPSAPLVARAYPELPVGDKSGPPLTRGFMFILVATVAAKHLSPEALAFINSLDSEAWYEGQLLETIVNEVEAKDPSLPYSIGRSAHYLMHKDLVAGGMTTPEAFISQLSAVWQLAVRGDAGEMRGRMVGPRLASVEMEQPYNCQLESGALHGFLDGYDCMDIRVDHAQCMRRGAPFCALDVRWEE